MSKKRKKDSAPEPMHAENAVEYRMRVISWLLDRESQSADSLVYSYTQETGKLISKELVMNSLDILHKRGLVKKAQDSQDKRRVKWSIL